MELKRSTSSKPRQEADRRLAEAPAFKGPGRAEYNCDLAFLSKVLSPV